MRLKGIKIRKTTVVLVLYYLIGIFILTFGQSLLPEHYYYDGKVIQDHINYTDSLVFWQSYPNTALLYKLLGRGSIMNEWLASFIGYSSAFFLTAYILKKIKWQWHPLTVGLLGVWNIFLAIYLGQYSKEPLAFLFAALIIIFSETKKGLLLGIFLTIFYAAFYRPYWIIILFLSTLNFLLFSLRFKLRAVIIIQLIAALFISQVGYFVAGKPLSEAKEEVNQGRESDEDSATKINNLIDNTSATTDFINSVINWLMLIFPLYLFSVSAIKYLPFIFFEIINVFLFIYIATDLLKKGPYIQSAFGEKFWRTILVALSWCMSFSFVQGIFEPDFGSFARHQTNLLPMWILLLATRFGLLKKSLPSIKTA